MTVKVSICIITYNQVDYVEQMLESVLAQKTSFNVEILMADDASTDGTQEVLKEYKRRYPGLIRLILRKKNLGATKNVYQLLEAAKGDYITGLEGDDFWVDTGFLQEQSDYLDNHPEFVATTGRCMVCDKSGERILDVSAIGNRSFWKFDKDEYTIDDFVEWKMPGHMSATMYRNFYHDNGFDGSVLYRLHPMIGDRTTLLHLVVRGPIHCYEKVVLCYRYADDPGDTNWMAISKKNNKRYDEYKLICDLERYAREGYGLLLDVSALKKSKIAAAVSVLIFGRSKEDFMSLLRILFYDGNPMRNIIVAFKAFCIKVYWIHRGQPDRRVVI